MKHGKKPTVAQRNRIKKAKLDPENWLVSKDKTNVMVLRHRYFNQTRTVFK